MPWSLAVDCASLQAACESSHLLRLQADAEKRLEPLLQSQQTGAQSFLASVHESPVPPEPSKLCVEQAPLEDATATDLLAETPVHAASTAAADKQAVRIDVRTTWSLLHARLDQRSRAWLTAEARCRIGVCAAYEGPPMCV